MNYKSPTCLTTVPQLGDIWKIQKHLGNLKIALSISAAHQLINTTHYGFNEIKRFCAKSLKK